MSFIGIDPNQIEDTASRLLNLVSELMERIDNVSAIAARVDSPELSENVGATVRSAAESFQDAAQFLELKADQIRQVADGRLDEGVAAMIEALLDKLRGKAKPPFGPTDCFPGPDDDLDWKEELERIQDLLDAMNPDEFPGSGLPDWMYPEPDGDWKDKLEDILDDLPEIPDPRFPNGPPWPELPPPLPRFPTPREWDWIEQIKRYFDVLRLPRDRWPIPHPPMPPDTRLPDPPMPPVPRPPDTRLPHPPMPPAPRPPDTRLPHPPMPRPPVPWHGGDGELDPNDVLIPDPRFPDGWMWDVPNGPVDPGFNLEMPFEGDPGFIADSPDGPIDPGFVIN